MRPMWLVVDPLSSSSLCGSVNSTRLTEDHSLDWVRARTKKMTDGNNYISNKRIRRKEKHKKASQRTFIPKRQRDILSKALEKEDHLGRVREYVVYVTVRDVYGRPKVTKRG